MDFLVSKAANQCEFIFYNRTRLLTLAKSDGTELICNIQIPTLGQEQFIPGIRLTMSLQLAKELKVTLKS
jgi:hypothetical protein